MKAHAQQAAPVPAAAPQRPPLQRKAQLGPVEDPLEREADRVAEAVVAGMPAGSISSANSGVPQRKCTECEGDEKTLQRKESGEGAVSPLAIDAAARAVSHGGSPLTPSQRAYFEPRFGRDLSHVRIHTDPSAMAAARAINARAYTFGQSIVFGPNRYAPSTDDGRWLLAHELAHTIQQLNAGDVHGSAESDEILESSANAAAP